MFPWLAAKNTKWYSNITLELERILEFDWSFVPLQSCLALSASWALEASRCGLISATICRRSLPTVRAGPPHRSHSSLAVQAFPEETCRGTGSSHCSHEAPCHFAEGHARWLPHRCLEGPGDSPELGDGWIPLSPALNKQWESGDGGNGQMSSSPCLPGDWRFQYVVVPFGLLTEYCWLSTGCGFCGMWPALSLITPHLLPDSLLDSLPFSLTPLLPHKASHPKLCLRLCFLWNLFWSPKARSLEGSLWFRAGKGKEETSSSHPCVHMSAYLRLEDMKWQVTRDYEQWDQAYYENIIYVKAAQRTEAIIEDDSEHQLEDKRAFTWTSHVKVAV